MTDDNRAAAQLERLLAKSPAPQRLQAPTSPDAVAAPSELDRLMAAYPAFWFSQETVGRHGTCWIARRKNGLGPGLHTVITADLAELHAALASQEITGHAR